LRHDVLTLIDALVGDGAADPDQSATELASIAQRCWPTVTRVMPESPVVIMAS